jgi:glucosamine--fructose-6-phosphate aminotransferase (isomerizing)
MLHGPLAAVSRDDLVILIAPPGASSERATDLARALHELEVQPVVLTAESNAEAFSEAHRFILPEVPEIVTPIPAIVPIQFFAYYLAVGLGFNPDLIHRDDKRQRAARAQFE